MIKRYMNRQKRQRARVLFSPENEFNLDGTKLSKKMYVKFRDFVKSDHHNRIDRKLRQTLS